MKLKPYVIYWSCAVLVMLAMQWQPLWGLVPFVAAWIGHSSYKKRKVNADRLTLPQVPVLEPRLLPVIPVMEAPAKQHEPSEATPEPAPQLVERHAMPQVYTQKIDWSEFNTPTWMRKQIKIDVQTAAPQTTNRPQFPEICDPDEVQNEAGAEANFVFS